MKVNVVSFRRVTAYLAVVAALAVSAAAQTAPPPAASSGGLDEAKRLIGDGKRTEAIAVLEGIASSDQAAAPQALQMMAGCYKILQTWSKAIECFEKLLADHPNSVAPDREVRIWIMDCYLANNEAEKALALRKELLSQYQSDAWKLYYIVGRRYVWQHKHTQAIPELQKVRELALISKYAPDVIDANKKLLHCYLEQKRWHSADELGQRLIKEYPDRAYEWQYEVGRCYYGQRKYDQAIEYLEPAAKLAPRNTVSAKDIFKVLLDSYDKIDRLDRSIPLAEKLVADYPADSAWQWRLAWYYLQRKEYGKAAPLFEKVTKTSRAQWEIRKSLIYYGQCLFKLGKGDQALEMVETYFKDKPDLWDERLLVKGGVLFYGPEDDAGCVAVLKDLVDQDAAGKKSTDEELVCTARELMYRALERSRNLTEAGKVLEDMAAETKDMVWLARAGEDYYGAKNYKEAIRVYTAVSDRPGVPDDIRARCMYGLALCYWDTGQKYTARRLAAKTADEYPKTEAAMMARGSLLSWSDQ